MIIQISLLLAISFKLGYGSYQTYPWDNTNYFFVNKKEKFCHLCFQYKHIFVDSLIELLKHGYL